MRNADFVMQYIVETGSRDVFAFVGGGMMYLADAMKKNSLIIPHFYQHEQMAGIAAEAYSKLKGKVAFCFATSGPGGLNLIEAITECWLDSVPVVFIIGQNKEQETAQSSDISGLRQYGAFGIDMEPIVSSITKSVYCAKKQDDFANGFRAHVVTAITGRPGPVVIVMPLDVQNELLKSGAQVFVGGSPVIPDVGQYEKVLNALEKAKRPLILAGQGIRVSGCVSHFMQFVEKYDYPVVTTQAGKDVIRYEHPNFVGHVGIKGDRAGNKAVMQADVIVCLGTSLNTQTVGYDIYNFAPDAEIYYLEYDHPLMNRWKTSHIQKVYSELLVFFNRT
jgi:acetolactate synthase-1/2/3 large subunit